MRQLLCIMLLIIAVCSLTFFEPKPIKIQDIKKKEKPAIEKVEPEEKEYENPITIF